MPHDIVIAHEERDALLAALLSEALEAEGHAVWIARCGAGADGALSSEQESALVEARLALVIIAEGRAGGGLLRSVEARVGRDAAVLPFVGDSSLTGVTSPATKERLARVGPTVSRLLRPARAKPLSRAPGRRLSWIAIPGLLALVLAGLLWALWPSGPPVVLTGSRSNAGWTVTFHLREPATEIEYRRAGDAAFVSTGANREDRAEDGNVPRSKTWVTFDELHGRVPFEVQYRGRWGFRKGPYPVVFDTDAEIVASTKDLLSMVPTWVSFRLFNGRKLCYFSTLLSYKYAFREIRFGVDTDAVERRVSFAPSDKPGIAGDDMIYVDLPEGVSFVTVELTFLDGTQDRKRFPFRAE